ncbi:MAG: GNAT family N-acetyltransferase [Phycisphaeraceae bacterium]|nr:GNAT family N-acetyltransferase [Phycisphaeraceae bacterium]
MCADDHSTTSSCLRSVIHSDLPNFFAHQLDTEACRMAAFTSDDPTDRAAFDAHWAKILAKDTVIVRTVIVRDSARAEHVAGHIASFIRGEEREVTYWIGREFWGKGVATRALQGLLDEVKGRPVFGRAAADNAPSIRVLLKCGFVEARRERGFANARGEEIEEVVMVLR